MNNTSSSKSNPYIIELPKVLDPRGNLTFLQNNDQIPFPIERVYWIYDVPGGEKRGGHAYKSLQEVIVVLSGSLDVVLHDGKKEICFNLNRSYYGLYVPKMFWRSMENFSTNTVVMILADRNYDENDYIRNWDEYKKG